MNHLHFRFRYLIHLHFSTILTVTITKLTINKEREDRKERKELLRWLGRQTYGSVCTVVETETGGVVIKCGCGQPYKPTKRTRKGRTGFKCNSMTSHFKTSPCKARLPPPKTITLANIEASTRRATRSAAISSTPSPLPTTNNWEARLHETGGSRGDPEVDTSTVGATRAGESSEVELDSEAVDDESPVDVHAIEFTKVMDRLFAAETVVEKYPDLEIHSTETGMFLRCRKVNCSKGVNPFCMDIYNSTSSSVQLNADRHAGLNNHNAASRQGEGYLHYP